MERVFSQITREKVRPKLYLNRGRFELLNQYYNYKRISFFAYFT